MEFIYQNTSTLIMVAASVVIGIAFYFIHNYVSGKNKNLDFYYLLLGAVVSMIYLLIEKETTPVDAIIALIIITFSGLYITNKRSKREEEMSDKIDDIGRS